MRRSTMRCPECGTDVAKPPTATSLRCLDCGALLSSAQTVHAEDRLEPGRKHAYKTHFGKFVAQVQTTGAWAGSYQFPSPKEHRQRLVKLIGNLSGPLREMTHPALARFHSFDADRLRCVWVIGGKNALVPLASERLPRSPVAVRRLIARLVEPLRRLHAAGLGACDLAPEMIFVGPEADDMVLVPTPWLASLARWDPDHPGSLPFAAPELELP